MRTVFTPYLARGETNLVKSGRILTPCPPRKHCSVCEARMGKIALGEDHEGRRRRLYAHQARDYGQRGVNAIRIGEDGIPLIVQAFSFGALANGFSNVEAMSVREDVPPGPEDALPEADVLQGMQSE